MSKFEFDGVEKNIQVEEVKKTFSTADGSVEKIAFVAKGEWFKFSKLKKDGTESKAFRDFTEDEVKPGDVVTVFYKPVTKTGDDGVPFTNNWLSYYNKLDNTRLVDTSPDAGKVPTIHVDDEVIDSSIPF